MSTSDNAFLEDWKDKIVVVYAQKRGDTCTFPKYQKEREKYIYKGTLTNQNLREILPHEIIIEFDHITKDFQQGRDEALHHIEAAKEALLKLDISFYITDHKGKSPHLRLLIHGLEEYPHEVRSEYKLQFTEVLLNGIKFKHVELDAGLLSSKNKLIPLEGQPHWKQCYNGAIEEIIFKHDEKPLQVNQEQLERVQKEIDNSNTFDDTIAPAADLTLEDVDTNALTTFWKKHYKKGQHNKMIMVLGGMLRRNGISQKDGLTLLSNLLKATGESKEYAKRSNELSYSWKTKKAAVHPHLRQIYRDEQKRMGVWNQLKKCFPKKKTKADDTKVSEKIAAVAKKYALFHSPTGHPFACVQNEVMPIRGRRFKIHIAKKYYEEYKTTVSSQVLLEALQLVEAWAIFDGPEIELHNRVAFKDNAIWYDLGNGSVIRITPIGWEKIDNSPILFQRFQHQKVQVDPDSSAKPQYFLRLFNHVRVKKEDQLLFTVALISSFIPNIPHVIPVIYGQKGSTKSTTLRRGRAIIDPSTIPLLSLPRDKKELAQMLFQHYCPYFDNVSKVNQDVSDMLCRAVTGDGITKRELYSDEGSIIWQIQRCLALNGINCAVHSPDLLERSLLIEQERVPKDERKEQRLVDDAFEKDLPLILGSAFSILSDAMQIKPSLKLKSFPRMADFSGWGEAIAQALGNPEGLFTKQYDQNIMQQHEEAISAHILGPVILKLIELDGEFEGNPAYLHSRLSEIAEDLNINTKQKGFPKAPHALSRKLNDLKSTLEDIGIEVEFDRTGKQRKVRIYSVISVKASSHDDKKSDGNDANDAKFSTLYVEEVVK